MKWTPQSPATPGLSKWDHITSPTPLGLIVIEWKSSRKLPIYSIRLDGKFLGDGDSLQDAKMLAEQYLFAVCEELGRFLEVPRGRM